MIRLRNLQPIAAWEAWAGTSIKVAAREAVEEYRRARHRTRPGALIFNDRVIRIGRQTEAEDLVKAYARNERPDGNL